MIVPSSSENNHYSPEHSFLEIVPNETFIKLAVGDSPSVKDIETLCKLKKVSKKLKEKVDLCWVTFILQTGRVSFYLPIYGKKFNINDLDIADKSLDAIKKQFPNLKKWEHLDYYKWDNAEPTRDISVIMGHSRQCILNNQGNSELWIMLGTNTQLECIDLKTNGTQYIDLKKMAHPISRVCHPCMVRSNNWIAICSRNGEIDREINIINLDSGTELYGSVCHSITDLGGEILELYSENEFLYVLCRDASGKSKFLKYDSKDWNSAPLERSFPEGNVVKFYMGNSEILFASVINQNQYELSAIKKDIWVVGTEADFKKAPSQDNFPILKDINNVLLTMTPSPKSNIVHPVALLEILDLENSVITKNCLLELPVNVHDIEDFQIVLDKIFILKKQNWNHLISCFDLNNGKLLNEFSVPKSGTGTNFRPTLVIHPPHIKLYFSPKNPYNPWACEATGIMDLNFEVDPIVLQETVESDYLHNL